MAVQMKSRVLVVEDDEQLRRIITSNLVARGHEVRQASDASMALDALAEEQPDLLILDINLPDRTGWDVLREANLPADVRVLMLTAVPVSPTSAGRVPAGRVPAEAVPTRGAAPVGREQLEDGE